MVMPDAGRKFPPITEISMATMALVIIGGIYIVSHIPEDVPLVLPALLAAAAAVLLLFNIVLVSRLNDFAWPVFKLVFAWSLAAYGVIAALLVFVFIHNNTPDDVMAFLAAMLVIYAINIPLLFGFSVARYQQAEASRA